MQDKKTRKGRILEFGYPFISLSVSGGVSYSWPDGFDSEFQKRKKDLVPFLEEKIREYIKEFDCATDLRFYPITADNGRGVLSFSLDTNAREIELHYPYFDYFLGSHNLDAYVDRFICFNVGADTIEFLDDGIKVPRIIKDSSKQDYFVPVYPLPEGFNVLSYDLFQKKSGILEKIFEDVNLGEITEIRNDPDYQKISCNKGYIEIKDGVCKGLNFFNGWDAARITAPISFLMNSFIDSNF